MAMLAEPKSKQKWSSDPRNTTWTNGKELFLHENTILADKRIKNCCSVSKSQYVCFTLLRSMNTAFPALLSCAVSNQLIEI